LLNDADTLVAQDAMDFLDLVSRHDVVLSVLESLLLYSSDSFLRIPSGEVVGALTDGSGALGSPLSFGAVLYKGTLRWEVLLFCLAYI